MRQSGQGGGRSGRRRRKEGSGGARAVTRRGAGSILGPGATHVTTVCVSIRARAIDSTPLHDGLIGVQIFAYSSTVRALTKASHAAPDHLGMIGARASLVCGLWWAEYGLSSSPIFICSGFAHEQPPCSPHYEKPEIRIVRGSLSLLGHRLSGVLWVSRQAGKNHWGKYQRVI